jgi:N-carbamoylputrescine amidase
MVFTVALLQIAPFGNDQSRNLAKGLQCCRDAKSLGADLAVFPELWNIGCTPPPMDASTQELLTASATDQRGDFFQGYAALAKELDMNIAITYLEAHRPKPRNTVSIINGQGNVVLNYSKVFICDFGGGCDVNFSPGESFGVCRLIGAQAEVEVGAMICADREFPEAATQLMLNGAELIVVPNACCWDELRTAGLKTRAFENLVGVAVANYPVPVNNGNSRAYTCAAWREGKGQDMLIAAAGEQEETLLARFDVDEIRAFRQAESWRIDYRRRPKKTLSHPL